MSPAVYTYLIYLTATALLLTLVARTLYTSGRTFMIDIFARSPKLVDPVNKLMVAGFCLIAGGWIVLRMGSYEPISSTREIFEMAANKVGLAMFSLAALHFGYIWWYFRGRSMSRGKAQQGSSRVVRGLIYVAVVVGSALILHETPLENTTALDYIWNDVLPPGLALLAILIVLIGLLIVTLPKRAGSAQKQQEIAMKKAVVEYVLQQALHLPQFKEDLKADHYEDRVPLVIRANTYVGKQYHLQFAGQPVRILNEAEIRAAGLTNYYLEITRLTVEKDTVLVDFRYPAERLRVGMRFRYVKTPAGPEWRFDNIVKQTY